MRERDELRLVLADDNYLVREGTRMLLEDAGDLDVIATADDAVSLLEAVEALQPDVVVTDIRMPPNNDLDGIEAARDIRRRHPAIGVVVLSQYADSAYALALFRDGTDGLGYLLKERVGDLDELLAAIRTVAAGGSAIDPRIVEVLVRARERRDSSPLRHLSERELDVLREMARGRNNSGIAQTLFVSESAVEKHVSQIFLKLGVSERPEISRRVAAVLAFLPTEASD